MDFPILSLFLKKRSDPSEYLLFLFPEKLKLPKNKPVDQQENLVKRKHQQEIKYSIDKTLSTTPLDTKEVQNGIFDE